MEMLKTQLWRLLPALLLASVIAAVAAAFFIWLLDRKLLAGGASLFWLCLFGASCALVGALVFGERQQTTLQRIAAEQNRHKAHQQRATYLELVKAASKAMEDLEDEYRNTAKDRMRIRVVYHKDAFSAMLAALGQIPAYELESAEAAIALTGLKRNLRDAQYMIDLYVPWQDAIYATEPVRQFAQIDLRSCKAFAKIHCRNLMRVLGDRM